MKSFNLKRFLIASGSALALLSTTMVAQAAVGDSDTSIYARVRGVVSLVNDKVTTDGKDADGKVQETKDSGITIGTGGVRWGLKRSYEFNGGTVGAHIRNINGGSDANEYAEISLGLSSGLSVNVGTVGYVKDDFGSKTDLTSAGIGGTGDYVGSIGGVGNGARIMWSGDVGGGSLKAGVSVIANQEKDVDDDKVKSNSIDGMQFGVAFSNDMFSVAVSQGTEAVSDASTDSKNKELGDNSEMTISAGLNMVPNLDLTLAYSAGSNGSNYMSGKAEEKDDNGNITHEDDRVYHDTKETRTKLGVKYTLPSEGDFLTGISIHAQYYTGTLEYEPSQGKAKDTESDKDSAGDDFAPNGMFVGANLHLQDGFNAGVGYETKVSYSNLKKVEESAFKISGEYNFSKSF